MDGEKDRGGFTVTEMVIVVFVAAAIAAVLLPMQARRREEARRVRCRNNLNQLIKGMANYLNEHGDGRFWQCPLGQGVSPNTYNGAEWLASLYWSGVIPDPGVFICPSSPDTNRDGVDIGSFVAAATFGSQTVSYAGMHYGSDPDEDGAVRDDYPPNKPMGSDDSQGDPHHGDGLTVIFFDSHVEFYIEGEADFPRAVGDRTGLLGELAN